MRPACHPPIARVCSCRSIAARRAAALLEVVISISILLLGMAAAGMAFSNGALYVERAERMARATEVTQRLLGELSTGLTAVAENQATGSCGDAAPQGEDGDMCWHVAVSPADQIPGLMNIEVEIFLGAPDSKPEQRKHVLTTYAQQAVFIPLNLQRDFGMTDEQLDQLTQAIPGGQAVFDPKSLDPRATARLPMDLLKQLLPVIMQAFGGQFAAEHITDITKALQTGDAAGLQQLVQEGEKQLQQDQPGTTPPPKPGGGQPPQPPRGNNPPRPPKTGGKR